MPGALRPRGSSEAQCCCTAARFSDVGTASAAAWAALALLTWTAGCGGATSSEVIGRSRTPRRGEQVELLLTTTEGELVEVADQRGSPVLLVVFATYDGASIASQRPLAAFTRDHLDTVVIAIAAQPDAAVFAREYARVIDPPYTVAFEEDPRVVEGTSALGVIEAVPAFVMLDSEGRERARHMGYASRRTLEQLWARATGRVARHVAADEGERDEIEDTPDRSHDEPAEGASDERSDGDAQPGDEAPTAGGGVTSTDEDADGAP